VNTPSPPFPFRFYCHFEVVENGVLLMVSVARRVPWAFAALPDGLLSPLHLKAK
jgi:hypothetical protein